MGLEDVFLQAILADPDDDTPRLIYADWLEERGDPRGEYIHVECALAKLGEDDPLRGELEVRREALLFRHEEEWFGRLTKLIASVTPGGGWLRCHRGFADTLYAPAGTFLNHAGEIVRLAPLLYVQLHRVSEHIARLAACEHLLGLRSLDLSWNGLGDSAVQTLANSPHLSRLRLLNLNHNIAADAGTRALAASSYLARLRELHLRSNRVGDVGAQALAASPHLGGLTRLDLQHNRIDGRRRTARALRERYGDALVI